MTSQRSNFDSANSDSANSDPANPESDGTPSAFERLHRKVQEELYAMRWTELRPIQVDAIHEIFTSPGHIVIAAQTASGKTEAAFLPILSKAMDVEKPGIHSLYIGPLKALINDQFRRVEELCRRTELSVHKWHGDVGASAKNRLVESPGGVLLITPESTESLFINKPQLLDKLFSELEYIVIDEMHSFMGSERGAHLKSLLCRLDALSRHKVRLLGLSATIGDLDAAGRWLGIRKKDEAAIIRDEADTKTVKYRIHGYQIKSPSSDDGENDKTPSTDPDTMNKTAPLANGNDSQETPVKIETDTGPSEGEGVPTPGASSAETRMVDDLYHAFKGKAALIFGNSKAKLEFYADRVIRKADEAKSPHRFSIHHGSLSKDVREEVEQDLREKQSMAVFCSSTLEMGIDVGNIEITGQLGAPWTVNALVQRLGRSGRKEGEPSIMRMYIDALEPNEDSSVFDRIYMGVLKAVAMSELMLEGWCEPPEPSQRHLSTLAHQILSVIAQYGGVRADALFERLVKKGAFKKVDKKLFARVLKSLGARDMIEQTPEGDLILGLSGERLVRSFDFYSVFKSPEEFSVVSKGMAVGSVGMTAAIVEGAQLILAGRRWRIERVDPDKKRILVTRGKGGRLPYFPGAEGCDVHPRVHASMRDQLFNDAMPRYLDDAATRMLVHAREEARSLDMEGNPFIQSGTRTYWFTWCGSRINRTLWALAHLFGNLKVDDEEVGLVFRNATADQIIQSYHAIASNPPSQKSVAQKGGFTALEKFDTLLDEELQSEIFVRDRLDLDGAIDFLKSFLSK